MAAGEGNWLGSRDARLWTHYRILSALRRVSETEQSQTMAVHLSSGPPFFFVVCRTLQLWKPGEWLADIWALRSGPPLVSPRTVQYNKCRARRAFLIVPTCHHRGGWAVRPASLSYMNPALPSHTSLKLHTTLLLLYNSRNLRR